MAVAPAGVALVGDDVSGTGEVLRRTRLDVHGVLPPRGAYLLRPEEVRDTLTRCASPSLRRTRPDS